MININKQELRLAAEKAKDNFIPAFMISTRDVLALLDELEQKDKKKSELKSYYEGVIADGSKRIAELEARTVTVKLPKRATADRYVDDDFDNSDLAAIYNACRRECEVKFIDACAAAGINLTVEG